MVAKRNVNRLIGLTALVFTPALVDCGGGLPGIPGVGGNCPPMDASAIMSANLGLQGEMEGKVKAGLAAAANLQNLALEIEGEVAGACGNLAKDLGASDEEIAPKDEAPGSKAKAACEAAVKWMGELKAKAGGKLVVKAEAPKCEASMSAMADCAASCDANIEPGSAEVKCEGGEISGKCGAECQGTCTVEAGAECSGTCGGTCSGACEADFSGKCGGNCTGKCDSADVDGKPCAGTCDGKCDAQGEGSCGGECKGSCSASCEMKGKADCSGSCSGGCSVEMEAPKCSGEVKPPEMSAECQANCDAEVQGKVECTKPGVVVKFEGAADAEAATKLKAAIEANLPALLKVAIGMKGRLEGVMATVQASVEGLSAVVKGGADAAMKVGACVAAALEAQVQASASINVSVEASASASGSAQAG